MAVAPAPPARPASAVPSPSAPPPPPPPPPLLPVAVAPAAPALAPCCASGLDSTHAGLDSTHACVCGAIKHKETTKRKHSVCVVCCVFHRAARFLRSEYARRSFCAAEWRTSSFHPKAECCQSRRTWPAAERSRRLLASMFSSTGAPGAQQQPTDCESAPQRKSPQEPHISPTGVPRECHVSRSTFGRPAFKALSHTCPASTQPAPTLAGSPLLIPRFNTFQPTHSPHIQAAQPRSTPTPTHPHPQGPTPTHALTDSTYSGCGPNPTGHHSATAAAGRCICNRVQQLEYARAGLGES